MRLFFRGVKRKCEVSGYLFCAHFKDQGQRQAGESARSTLTPLNHPRATGLDGELLDCGEVVLFAADFTVVFGGHLEEFEAAIAGEEAALIAERLHFVGREWLEIHGNFQVLIEDLHGVDAADGGGDGQAHGVVETLFGGDGAVANELAAASETFHSKGGDAATGSFRQDLSLETSEGSIAAVERHLHGVEGKIVREHLQMDFGIFVAGESDEANFALLFGGGEGFRDAVWSED
jgi:hypothetical protein